MTVSSEIFWWNSECARTCAISFCGNGCGNHRTNFRKNSAVANVRYRQCMVSAKKLNEVYGFVVFLKKLKISNLFPTSSWSRKAMYLHPWQYKTYQNFKVCKHNMTLDVFFFLRLAGVFVWNNYLLKYLLSTLQKVQYFGAFLKYRN